MSNLTKKFLSVSLSFYRYKTIFYQSKLFWTGPNVGDFSKKIDLQKDKALTLIGMREGTFIPLSFLDLTLSAEFLSKISKKFGGEN